MLSNELTIVVGHMKKSNEFIKTTNQELIKLNRSMFWQVRLLWVLTLISLLLIGGLALSLYELHELGSRLDVQLNQQTITNEKLADVVLKLTAVGMTTKQTKDAVNAQPLVSVKPADSTDPTSQPMLVVQPRPKKFSKPKGVEIPFDEDKLRK